MPKARYGQCIQGTPRPAPVLLVSLESRPNRNGDPRPKCKKSLCPSQRAGMGSEADLLLAQMQTATGCLPCQPRCPSPPNSPECE